MDYKENHEIVELPLFYAKEGIGTIYLYYCPFCHDKFSVVTYKTSYKERCKHYVDHDPIKDKIYLSCIRTSPFRETI